MTNGPLEKTFLPFKTSSLVFPANDKNINLLLQLKINKNNYLGLDWSTKFVTPLFKFQVVKQNLTFKRIKNSIYIYIFISISIFLLKFQQSIFYI